MDGEGHIPEDLSVSLRRPGDDREQDQRPLRRRADSDNGNAGPPAATDNATSGRRDRPPSPTGLSSAGSAGQATSASRGAYANLVHRIDELTTALTSATARMDTLTDAMATLQDFVDKRMADVDEILSEARMRATRDPDPARSAAAEGPGTADPPPGGVGAGST